MKCPHCNGNHPDNYKFCPITGKEIPDEIPEELLVCENEDCIDFGKHILPLNSRFCPSCGRELKRNIHSTVGNQTFWIGNLLFEMIRIEGGTFWMGAQSINLSGKNYDPEACGVESPVHKVILSDYSIGKYPVTQELWEAVMGNNSSFYTRDPSHPVGGVSWNDIVNEFLPKINDMLRDQLNGRHFVLPSEAQWEYAVRGGTKSKGYRYSGSNKIDDVAWYGYYDSIHTATSGNSYPVGQKLSNEIGLYDMSGNVYEWCSDWYRGYDSNSQTDPTGPTDGSYRVLRGGSWIKSALYCRVSSRINGGPGRRDYDCGFRLALVMDSQVHDGEGGLCIKQVH